MSELLVHPAAAPAADGTFLDVTPQSAGWTHVGFEVLRLEPGVVAKRDTRDREVCIVVVSGTATVNSAHGEFEGLGGRSARGAGPPDAVYLPPGSGSGSPAPTRPRWRCAGGRRPAAARARGCCPATRSRSRPGARDQHAIHPILMADTSRAKAQILQDVLEVRQHLECGLDVRMNQVCFRFGQPERKTTYVAHVASSGLGLRDPFQGLFGTPATGKGARLIGHQVRVRWLAGALK